MRDIKEHVDTNSVDLGQGVGAGLNSAEDKKRQGANESGQELKDEVETKQRVSDHLFREPTPPLFLNGNSDGKKGNAQDEKDESEE